MTKPIIVLTDAERKALAALIDGDRRQRAMPSKIRERLRELRLIERREWPDGPLWRTARGNRLVKESPAFGQARPRSPRSPPSASRAGLATVALRPLRADVAALAFRMSLVLGAIAAAGAAGSTPEGDAAPRVRRQPKPAIRSSSLCRRPAA